ncbi:MAG: gliding motility protein GldM [Sinomicrobium sp.]|nr:gliding motility protein GldM [Sinomicrobium sp.]
MAGKQSPRQRMINLMYLVFIAMLALNMSKEVLSAFGLMNEKLEVSNTKADQKIAGAYEGLAQKAGEQPEKFGSLFADARKIRSLSSDFYTYLANLKTEMTGNVNDKTDYEVMDQPDYLDEAFFRGDQYAPEGREFVDKVNNYRTEVLNILGDKYEAVRGAVTERFATGDANGKVKNRDGRPVDWLNYHFEGFPLIASVTKITQMQSDIKNTEEDILAAMLEGQLTAEVSLTNYTTLLEQDRSAYYQGETYDGSIVLGRTSSTSPKDVELFLDGRKLSESEYTIQADGKVKLNVNTGTAGDHQLTGNLLFDEGGQTLPVPVNQRFSVITKPNEAVISADKMNVVYRGVANPITISMPGVPDNKVSAAAAGLSRSSGSKYTMNPGAGREVTIRVTGEIDGQSISSNKTFRIKDIPRPSGTIRGEFGDVKMPRSNLEISTVGAILEDFDFDLDIAVSGFKFKVPGQPTVQVNGNRLDDRAKNALRRAGRGDNVQIFDIQAYITNNRSYKLKKVSPVVVEITN